MWTIMAAESEYRFVLFQIPQSGFRPCGPSPPTNRAALSSSFQSLSRDSVHVDPFAIARETLKYGVSIPPVGIPSMWTERPGNSHHLLPVVSIPQSGFRPCGPPRTDDISEHEKVSIPQSGFRPCGRWIRPARLDR